MGLDENKIWIDGCFDFAHHGHAGALLQARQIGQELFVGIHTDEEIGHNKGPVVMKLDERVTAVEACKWSTQSVPGAPYVTDYHVMDEYGCKYVVHGDDITTDADGNDCYQQVKDMGRFVVVKRTPNISTTDIVGRMLSGSKSHHFANGTEIPDMDRIKLYATGADGHKSHSGVWAWDTDLEPKLLVAPSEDVKEGFKTKTYYVDGAFDLFFVAHIEFLRKVRELADREGAKILVGVYSDQQVNHAEGSNFPIMNQFERSLCVLQCKYVDGVLLNPPTMFSKDFVDTMNNTQQVSIQKVFRGASKSRNEKKYDWAKEQNMYQQIEHHKYEALNTADIVNRVLTCSEVYRERQKKKGWKSEHESEMQNNNSN